MANVIAYKNLAGDFGMEIVRIEYGIDDHVIWKFSNEKKHHRSVLYYTSRIGNGRAYFKWRGVRYYTDEFIRV